MSDAIIAALITGACAIIAQIFISAKSTRELFSKLSEQSQLADAELDKKLEKFQAVTNEKIDELSRRVEKHNNVVERVYKLEQDTAVQAEKIKVANNRLNDLEKPLDSRLGT